MAGERKKRRIRWSFIVLVVIILAIIAGAVLVFVNRDAISDKFSQRSGNSDYEGEPYTFESGSMQVFAGLGNGMAVCSANGMQVLDSSGGTVVRQIFSMATPAIVSSGVHAAAFDVGGASIYVANLKGECERLDNTAVIINASMNKEGYIALCTESPGYKGAVTIYNPELEPVYRWNSGEGYLLGAAVSPDNRYFAAFCADGSGSSVHIFSLTSETEQAKFVLESELITDISWLSDNRICYLSQSRCGVIDRAGGDRGGYDFGGLYLTDYSFGGSGYAVLMLSKYRSGGTGYLTSVGTDGKLMGQTEFASGIDALSANGRVVAVSQGGTVTALTSSMTVSGAARGDTGLKDILVRDKGDVILASSYSARVIGI